MKKLIVSFCSGIILSGAVYSFYNAANDYGLATISLPPAITAQGDDTSFGGDETPGNPLDCYIPGILSYSKKNTDTYKDLLYVTDEKGAFSHPGGRACCFHPVPYIL